MKRAKPAASRYESLRRECERELLNERYQPATRFYGFRELMREKDVSQSTLERALRPLIEDDKILEPRPKSGLYVTSAIQAWRERRKSSRVKRLGLILPFWASDSALSMPAGIIRGLCGNADTWRLELIPNTFEESQSSAFVDRLLNYGLDVLAWIQPKPLHLPNLIRLHERGRGVVTLGRSFDGFDAPCVKLDAVSLSQQAVQWVRDLGETSFAVVGGPSTDRFYREIYDALLGEAGSMLEPSNIAELFDVPDEANRTRAFVAAHPQIRAWIYLTANNLFHVLPPKQLLPPEGMTAEQSRHRYLYLDMGVEAVRGFWPYSNVKRIAIDFEAMGRAAITAAEAALDGSGAVLSSVPVSIKAPVSES